MATLADELGPYLVDLSRVEYIAKQLLVKLGYLHAEGRVHPALTPANIAVAGAYGEPMLDGLDAPIARDAPWAAPETIREGRVTVASNLYSVAAIMKALLQGRAQALLDLCLDPDPSRRPRSAQEAGLLSTRPAGRFTPQRIAYSARDGTEEALVAALRANPRDGATRDVYADWLESHGAADRAAFVRGTGETASEGHATWRAIVSRAAITRCGRNDCPSTWEALAPTDFDNVRRCSRCTRDITYCTSVIEAELQHAADRPFAIDDALDPDEVQRAIELRGPGYLPLPANPPLPRISGGGADTSVLGRFFGWFRRR